MDPVLCVGRRQLELSKSTEHPGELLVVIKWKVTETLANLRLERAEALKLLTQLAQLLEK